MTDFLDNLSLADDDNGPQLTGDALSLADEEPESRPPTLSEGEQIALTEANDVLKGFRDRAQREDQRVEDATDSEYWIAICFQTRDQKEEFLEKKGWEGLGDKYLDGMAVAEHEGIMLDSRIPPIPEHNLHRRCAFFTDFMDKSDVSPSTYIANGYVSWYEAEMDIMTGPFFFVNPSADGSNRGVSSSVPGALKECLTDLGWIFDSPLERDFWKAWSQRVRELHLQAQHEVAGGKYRLDFAHVPTQTAIEVDGFSYHSDRRQFERDWKRDRELSELGWRVIRFASQELTSNIEQCVEQAARMIQSAR